MPRSNRIRSVIYGLMLSIFFTAIESSAAEPKWNSLLTSIDTARDVVAGKWIKSSESLSVSAAQGTRLSLQAAPEGEYDLRCSFTRRTGQHSVGLIVVQNGRQVVFEVDAWGSHLGGFQNIDGKSIRDNPTRCENVKLDNNKRYTLTVEVRKNSLRGMLDDREIAQYRTTGQDLSLSDLWAMPEPQHLGLVAWDSDTIFHSIEIRALSELPATTASTTQINSAPKNSGSKTSDGKTSNSSTTKSKSSSPGNSNAGSSKKSATNATTKSATNARTGTKTLQKSMAKSSSKSASATPDDTSNSNTAENQPARKHVLIIIASHHFFYREYGDPRQELERAGIKVTVAAGRKAPSHPHPGSGQGPDGGVVQPDLALSAVKSADYDAVLFSGGWGSSMYQFAFTGRYNEPAYNGDRATKTEANRIINEFLAEDKYVCALCNGVTVLAWARVDGKSPLAGKRVCAPTRQAAAGIYDGRPAQPSCRWHPEANGAIMSPAGAIGQPGTAVDDVLVDGKIITGEDDISAREMGRRIVEVLSR